MAERNKNTPAIILSVKISGENNRNVTYLSPDFGICTAILYGGPKSKLRSLVQPFNSGILFYYEDNIKHSVKITDFDVKNVNSTFSTNIYKMWAANLACEIVLKTKCAGEYKSAFDLLMGYIKGMDLSTEENARLGTIRFLWRYIGLMGLQCNVHQCCSCSKSIVQKNENGTYIPHLNGFVCRECSPSFKESSVNLEADSDALTYLEAVNTLSPKEVRNITLMAKSAYQLKQFVYYAIENACGCKLMTIESGFGIL